MKILIRLQKKSYSEFLSIRFCDSRQVSQKTQAPCRFSRTKGVSEDGGSGLGLLSSTVLLFSADLLVCFIQKMNFRQQP